MKKARFAIAIDSYIVRKGISSILKTMTGVDVARETDNVDILRNILKEGGIDFFVVSPVLLSRLNPYAGDLFSIEEKFILVHPEELQANLPSVRLAFSVKTPKNEIITELDKLVYPFLEERSNPEDDLLSDREKTILKHVARGLTNREIAEKLFLSLHTVTTHRKNIGNKLGIKSVSGLTVYAIVNNIISIEDIQKQ